MVNQTQDNTILVISYIIQSCLGSHKHPNALTLAYLCVPVMQILGQFSPLRMFSTVS